MVIFHNFPMKNGDFPVRKAFFVTGGSWCKILQSWSMWIPSVIFCHRFFLSGTFSPRKKYPSYIPLDSYFQIYIYIYICYTYILWHDDRVISRKSPICGVACCMAARVLPVADMKCGSSEVNAENVRNAVFKTSQAWEQTSQTRLLWPGGIPMFWHLFLKQFLLGDPTHLTHGKVMIQVHYIVLIGDIPIRTYSYGLWKSPWYTL